MASTTQNVFWKRDNRVTFIFGSQRTICNQKQLISTKALPRITLEEMNLLPTVDYATSSCQFLIKSRFMFSMILSSIPKLSIIVDTAFRKD